MSDLEDRLSALADGSPKAVTVGTFDGVHNGHRRLLATLRDEASRDGIASVAIAFRRPPRLVIDPGIKAAYLSTLDHRVELLKATGVDAVLTAEFDEELRSKTAAEFIEMMRTAANVRLLVTGPGARIGSDRQTVDMMAEAVRSAGVRLVEAEAVTHEGQTVSSSAVRNALAGGDVRAAAAIGRHDATAGNVIRTVGVVEPFRERDHVRGVEPDDAEAEIFAVSFGREKGDAEHREPGWKECFHGVVEVVSRSSWTAPTMRASMPDAQVVG